LAKLVIEQRERVGQAFDVGIEAREGNIHTLAAGQLFQAIR
jgi:hypothetical protein